jgi:hypothetical protein
VNAAFWFGTKVVYTYCEVAYSAENGTSTSRVAQLPPLPWVGVLFDSPTPAPPMFFVGGPAQRPAPCCHGTGRRHRSHPNASHAMPLCAFTGVYLGHATTPCPLQRLARPWHMPPRPGSRAPRMAGWSEVVYNCTEVVSCYCELAYPCYKVAFITTRFKVSHQI